MLGDLRLAGTWEGMQDQCLLHTWLKAQQPLLRSQELCALALPVLLPAGWEGAQPCARAQPGAAASLLGQLPMPGMGQRGWQGAGQAPTGSVPVGGSVGWHRGSVPRATQLRGSPGLCLAQEGREALRE